MQTWLHAEIDDPRKFFAKLPAQTLYALIHPIAQIEFLNQLCNIPWTIMFILFHSVQRTILPSIFLPHCSLFLFPNFSKFYTFQEERYKSIILGLGLKEMQTRKAV